MTVGLFCNRRNIWIYKDRKKQASTISTYTTVVTVNIMNVTRYMNFTDKERTFDELNDLMHDYNIELNWQNISDKHVQQSRSLFKCTLIYN